MTIIHILVVGLNHRTAPVEIREKFSLSEADLPVVLQELRQISGILECVIVGTCNRTEIYAVMDRLDLCGYTVREFMAHTFNIHSEKFSHYLYQYENDAAIEHLLRVTTGLDSMIMGETQIIGQVRSSFLLAQRLGSTGLLFNTLFKQALTMAKRAHTETSISEHAVSISYAAVELGKRVFGELHGKHVMVIGAGKMSELTLSYLINNGVDRVTIANRTLQNAASLAKHVNGHYCTIDDIDQHLPDVDIVISSTGSAQVVLTKEQVQSAMQGRSSRRLLLIDIAVPRDLDPRIADVPDVLLHDIDDLEGIIESNVEQRRDEAVKVETMIQQEIATFHIWHKSLGVGPMINALQEKATTIHEKTMESLLNRLPKLGEREEKMIRMLTKSMMNQLMRDPITRIKQMVAEGDSDESLEFFAEMFALEEDAESHSLQYIATHPTKIAPQVKVKQINSVTQDLVAR